jgi:hypothetical protein
MKKIIADLKPHIRQLSVNNLLYALIKNHIKIKNIRLEPVYNDVVKGATIVDIWSRGKTIYVAINVFKIKVFTPLHEKYLVYEKNDLTNALESLKLGVKTLLYRYVFGSSYFQQLIKDNIYLRAFNSRSTIANIMTIIYKQLTEDYTVIADYERKIEVVANKPSMVGKSYIDSIYLGTYRRQYMHIISIKVFFSSWPSQKNNLDTVIEKLDKLQAQIECLGVKLKIEASNLSKTAKNSSFYLGDYSL